ncbi:phospholipase D family protein [Providencia alcalifaciens]|uniref:phospholipase D n=1 Tax=Providencia alcalifaciens 205/92 TaxID=1256988 RepID=A0AAV3M511_9GAMM|nr:phospholipase D family protein [Providencia alcalifaciens]EUD10809.1 PLD-like domain protein [Providencia alcalifaciens 205/92]MTC25133.1 phospholipase D family protein [Providencia alcalifaciens]MTC61811.1 phospholipase D family protein [Providencia alcalifaciens]
MKKCCAVSLLLISSFAYSQSIDIGFSPNGNALSLILKTINNSKNEIFVAAYSFTSKPIAEALLKAKQRGVDVIVVADKKLNNTQYTAVTFLQNHHISVCLTDKYAIMHNKFIVSDRSIVQTGSFNYTSSAVKRNAENVIVIKDKEVAKAYVTEFDRLWSECNLSEIKL